MNAEKTYAVTGSNGQVGTVIVNHLLSAGAIVRTVVRNAEKADLWKKKGCEIAMADMNDSRALKEAFAGTHGIFILLPPNFDPKPGLPESKAIIAAIRGAIESAVPKRVVVLSTIGAQAKQQNLLSQLSLLEESLSSLPPWTTFLRSAWFMENFLWDIPSAREKGTIPSFLQPLDKPIPMVATEDVGRTAAKLLLDESIKSKIVELEGPRRLSPNEAAATFSKLLNHPVRMNAVPRESWETLFKSQGALNPLPRIRMLDGFNEGWIQ